MHTKIPTHALYPPKEKIMTVIITPTPAYPLAFWLRQVQGYLLTSNVDGVTRLVVEIC